MTKSQTKMSKLATQIQRLAKGLNKFTISNILQLIDANDLEIEFALKELVEECIGQRKFWNGCQHLTKC